MVKAIWKVYKVYEPELQKMLDELKDKKLLLTFEKRKDLNLFLNKAEVNKKI